jgi:hypothetical protein
MQAKPTSEPTGSPIPGVIPEPVRVRHDTVAPDGAPTAKATAPGTTPPAAAPVAPGPPNSALAKLLGVLRGDKYMANAYPPEWHTAWAVPAGDEVVHAAEPAAPVPAPASEG